MLLRGILNPHINSLLSRVRHTNSLVIADRGFPSWPNLETVDISLVDGVPTVCQVLEAILPNFNVGSIYMAKEFLDVNGEQVKERFTRLFAKIPTTHEAHIEFKRRVPGAVGLIRTGDNTPYANLILISA